MTASATPLHRVAQGLSCMYAAMCIVPAAFLLGFVVGPLVLPYIPEPGSLICLAIFFVASFVLAVLLNGIGRTVCMLWAPATLPGRTIVIICTAADAISLLLALGSCVVGTVSAIQEHGFSANVVIAGGLLSALFGVGGWFGIASVLLALFGTVLFIAYLRNLAHYVGEHALVRRASRLLWVCCVLLAYEMIVNWVGNDRLMKRLDPQLDASLIMLLSVLPVVVFLVLLWQLISYGKLLTYLRRAVQQYAAGGIGGGEQRAEPIGGPIANAPPLSAG